MSVLVQYNQELLNNHYMQHLHHLLIFCFTVSRGKKPAGSPYSPPAPRISWKCCTLIPETSFSLAVSLCEMAPVVSLCEMGRLGTCGLGPRDGGCELEIARVIWTPSDSDQCLSSHV